MRDNASASTFSTPDRFRWVRRVVHLGRRQLGREECRDLARSPVGALCNNSRNTAMRAVRDKPDWCRTWRVVKRDAAMMTMSGEKPLDLIKCALYPHRNSDGCNIVCEVSNGAKEPTQELLVNGSFPGHKK